MARPSVGEAQSVRHTIILYALVAIAVSITFHVFLSRSAGPPSSPDHAPSQHAGTLESASELNAAAAAAGCEPSCSRSSPMHAQQFAVRYWLEGLVELMTLIFFYMDLKWVQTLWRPLFLRVLAFLWIILPTEWLIVMGQNNGNVGCLRGQKICNIHLALCIVQLSTAFLLLLYDTMLDARRDIFPKSLRIRH